MSKTLFWYIFWSLLKVFLMTTASLAGIMSLGGLLRPLTDNGLNLGQVNRMLAYLTPAMRTYSLPVAALFAATTVYGRFSSDNELTAMRACGISYLSARRFSIALPALVLGLVVAVASLLMLCFVVPLFSLKAQEVIYSNIGRLIVSRIEREHELDFPTGIGTNRFVVFAEEAHSMQPDPKTPQVSRVELIGPAVVTYEPPVFPDPILTPKEFWMARRAIVNIARSGSEGGAAMTVQLEDGIRFPREFYGGSQVGVAGTTFGPTPRQSLIGENVKFMNVTRLTELAQDPSQSKRVQDVLSDLIRRDQETGYRAMIVRAFRPESLDDSGHATFDFGKDVDLGDQFQIGGQGVKAAAIDDEVVIGPKEMDLSKPLSTGPRLAWFGQMTGSQQIIQGDAGELRISTKPDLTGQQIIVSVELNDAALHTQSGVSERASFSRSFAVPMPPAIQAMAKRTLADYLTDPHTGAGDAALLRHEEAAANNAVRSELHSRASFAVSCLSLVMIGCALGMMFRSGNFLNAFAVSFIPALLCITLIVCGQQCATHVPDDVAPGYHDPLHMGLAFIWAGNVTVIVAVIWLTTKLQRQSSATLPIQMPTEPQRTGRDSRLWVRPRGLALLFVIWMLVRWIFSSFRQLVPDEAYYWVWSRHLAMSYVDHPPMIAWLIRLGTDICGTSQLGVRFMMTIVTAGTILIITLVARRLITDWRAVVFVSMALLACPLLNAIGSLATPDTPACFFQAAALACALMIFAPGAGENRGSLWLAFGVCLGLGLISKYTSVLLGLSVFLALLWTPQGRRHFRTPWPWLGALIAVAIFSPVILWNAHHQWASFKFQLHHGLSAGEVPPVSSLLAYVGGQFAVSTPIIFFLVLFVLWICAGRGNPMYIRILLLSTVVPLLFFAFSALHHRPEANWPMFAYLPGTLLIGRYFGEYWTRQREGWAKLAVIVALFGTIFIHWPEAGWALFPRLHMPPWEQQFGWRDLAAKVDSLRHGAPVYSVDYGYASELSFYLSGRPEVWPLPFSDRPTAFDDMPGYPPVSQFDRVILVRKQLAGVAMTSDWRVANYLPHAEVIHFDSEKLGHVVHRNLITIATR